VLKKRATIALKMGLSNVVCLKLSICVVLQNKYCVRLPSDSNDLGKIRERISDEYRLD
jgi:hypothetical protein